MATAFQDTHYAFRALRRNKAFAAVAIACIALGVGATTTIFTAVNSLILRPLPYPEAGRIVVMWASRPRQGRE